MFGHVKKVLIDALLKKGLLLILKEPANHHTTDGIHAKFRNLSYKGQLD